MENIGTMNLGLSKKKLLTLVLVSFLGTLALIQATVIASKQNVFDSKSALAETARASRAETPSNVSRTITRTAAGPHIYLSEPQALITTRSGDQHPGAARLTFAQ